MDQLPMKIKIDDCWKPQLRALLIFFLYLIKPRFYYISAGLMRSTSHGDVSMMDKKTDQDDPGFIYIRGSWPWKHWKH